MSDKDFNFVIPIEGYEIRRADITGIGEGDEEWLVVYGVASDSSKDKYKGKMSARCIVGMVDCVNAKFYPNIQKAKADNEDTQPVGVDIDHSEEWPKQIGFVKKAAANYNLTPEQKAKGLIAPLMEVELWIDLKMSHGRDLQRSLDKGAKLGLSIFGKVNKVYKAKDDEGDLVEHFDDVQLKKIAITSRPVNKNTWVDVIKRSMDVNLEETIIEENKEQESTIVEAPAVQVEEEVVKSETEEGTETVTTDLTPTPTPTIVPEYILKADVDVLRSYVDTQITELKEVLSPLPDFVDKTNEVITSLKGTIDNQNTLIRSLTDRLVVLENEPNERKGTSIVRNTIVEEATKKSKVLGSDWSPEVRRSVIAELQRQGRETEAIALIAGLLNEPEVITIDDPLLPNK